MSSILGWSSEFSLAFSEFHCLEERVGDSESPLRRYTFLNFGVNAAKRPFVYQQDSVHACSKTDK